MARTFTRASGHYIEFPHHSSYDFTVSASFTIYLLMKPTATALTVEGHPLQKVDQTGAAFASYPFNIALDGAAGGDPIQLKRYDGTNNPVVSINFPGVAGDWVFVMCGRDEAQATNKLFMTAALLGIALPALTYALDTTTGTTEDGKAVRLAYWPFSSNHFDGDLGDMFICNAAHSLSTGQGVAQGKILPPNMVLGSCVCGHASPEPDITGGGHTGTVSGAVKSWPHPTSRCSIPVPRFRTNAKLELVGER